MAKGYQKAAERWARSMASASTAYSEGIDGVTVSPTELAAANEQGYLAGTAAAVSSGKFKRNLQKVTLADWKRVAKEKGAARIGAGATAAKSKVEKFWQVFGPIQEAAAEQVRAMPKTTFEERMARMISMATMTHEAGQRGIG